MKLTRRLTVGATSLVALSLITAQVACGQEFIEGGAIRVQMDQSMEEQMEEELELSKARFEQAMAVRIDELSIVCELSDDQVTKLKVAAKGAVAQSVKKAKKGFDMMMAQFGGIQILEGEGEAIGGDVDDEDELEGDGGIDVEFAIPDRPLPMMSGSPDPEKEKIWKNTLKSVLTAEQKAKHEAIVAERLRFRRESAVNSFVARVDRRLLLTVEQRDILVPLIDKKYGQQLVMLADNSMGAGIFGHNVAFGFHVHTEDGGMPGDEVTGDNDVSSPIKDCLTEKQYSIWVSAFEAELSMIDMQAEAGPFIQFGN